MGRMAGEKDIVANYFKRRRNAQGSWEEIFTYQKIQKNINL